MKAVVKGERHLLTSCHEGEKLDFVSTHQDWTLNDWKRVVLSYGTKINRWEVGDVEKGREGLSDRLMHGTMKF